MKTFRKLISLSLLLLMGIVPAFATPTAITVQQLKQNNYAVVAGDLTLTMTAADTANGNSFLATGTEIVIVQNTDTAAHTITVTSVADSLGRSDTTLTSYSVAASAIVAIQMKSTSGWIQNGTINISGNSALLKIAVVRYQ